MRTTTSWSSLPTLLVAALSLILTTTTTTKTATVPFSSVDAFSIPDLMNFHDVAHASATSVVHHGLSSSIPHLKHAVNAQNIHQHNGGNALAFAGSNVLEYYKHLLKTHPLPTKMITGATLAVSGDAIAQRSQQPQSNTGKKNDGSDESSSSSVGVPYDKRRAVSFAVFDMAYRALQHVSFPIIVAVCHGQLLGSIPGVETVFDSSQRAAMEQTLASQLGIVPFLYYPAFFTLTAAIQGLDTDAAIQRAKDNFIPLMKRNLLFWIPVQYVQFGYIQEDLQIPFLSVCGLAWTFILSVAAGSARTYDDDNSTEQSSTDQRDHSASEIRSVPTTTTSSLPTHQQEQLAAVAAAVVLKEADEPLSSNLDELVSSDLEETIDPVVV